jgi:hypothetical protein
VIYRSRTGDYDVPAIVNCTAETLNAKGVEAGHVPDADGAGQRAPDGAHAGQAGDAPRRRRLPRGVPHGRSENVAGCYQEWDIPLNDPATGEVAPGTWRWPVRV